MNALLRITQAAPQMQIQDLGRFGHLHQGFSISGAMDERAFAANNALLGNEPNAAQLEIALGGLQLEVLQDCLIALAGAYAQPLLDGKPLVNWHSHWLRAGQKLQFAYPKQGVYSYLAVAGGWQCPPFLGSRSTCARLNIYPQTLVRGSELLGLAQNPAQKAQGMARKAIPELYSEVLDVLPSYQYAAFSAEMRDRFVSQTWRVQSGNRMGCLLNGAFPIRFTGGELLSEGIVAGAIQISNDGMPIVLQKDAQSIGGYPKIGTLTAQSRAQLVQMPSGSLLKFRFVEV